MDVRHSVVQTPLDPEGGGDLFLCHAQEDGAWVVVGDVMGHGPAAHVHAEALAALLAELLGTFVAPGAALAALQERSYAYLRRERTFASLLLVRLSCDGQGRLAAAGQCPPLLLRRRGGRRELCRLWARGLLLGGARRWHYPELSFPWQAGDFLVLYTDGLPEALVGAGRLGEEALARTCLSLADEDLEAASLLAALKKTYPSLRPTDDFTLATVMAL